MYYVYIYYHPDTLVPFYVGYGKGNRMMAHLKEAKRSLAPTVGDHKLNSIRQLLRDGKLPIIKKISECLSKEQACNLEIDLISKIGRADLGFGPLTNKTNGGDGNRCWDDESKLKVSNRLKGTISVKDANGHRFRVKKDDPRWVSRELVGQNSGKCNITNKEGKLTGYVIAKHAITGESFRVKKDDPRWVSGELVGIRFGQPAHPNLIAAAKAKKGVPKSKEHALKVSTSIKLLKWYMHQTTMSVGRFKEGLQPAGYIRVSGPHKRTPL